MALAQWVPRQEGEVSSANGYPRPVTLESFAARIEWETANATQTAEEPAPRSFKFELGLALSMPLPAPVCLSRHFKMFRGRPIVISGRAGSAKTWLAYALALAIVTDAKTAWGDLIDVQIGGRVRIICYENIGEVSARRLQRLAFGMGFDLAELGDRLGRCALPSIHLSESNQEFVLAQLIQACTGIDVAIVDSLRAACPDVEENSSTVRKYLDLLTRVTHATGTIFIVVHHEGKPPSDGQRDAQNRMRGSSAIADAIDCSVSVTDAGKGSFAIEQGKQSWGNGDPIAVRLVDVGVIDTDTHMTPGIRFEAAGEADGFGLSPNVSSAMEKIVRALGASLRPLGSRELRELIHGANEAINRAIAILRERGTIEKTDSGQYALTVTESQTIEKMAAGACPRTRDACDETLADTDEITKHEKSRCPRVSARVPRTRQSERVRVSRPLRDGHDRGTQDTHTKTDQKRTRPRTRKKGSS